MRVDDGGCGDQIAEPAAGERERLAHRAGDDQLRRVLADADCTALGCDENSP